ncbi:MAG: universal stress protein [Acidimicrobiales bacterium]
MTGVDLARAFSTNGRVVVGIDNSAGGRDALRHAAEVARWRHWTLHIVHTWHISYPLAPYGNDLGVVDKAVAEAAEATVADIVKDVLGEEHGLDVRVTVAEGPAARILVAASEGADLLVVGSRGRGGFSSLALGSVGQSCVHHAHCPVLIVRPRTHEQAA